MKSLLSFVLVFCSTFFPVSGQPGGDTLKICVYHSPPFGMKINYEDFGGLMVLLWEDIARELGVAYQYEVGDMNHLIAGLKNGRYDIGLGAISITPQREQLIDFSYAVNPSGTGIATSKKATSTSFLKKWTPILVDLLELVASLIVMLLISAVFVFLVEKKYGNKTLSERSIQSIADGLWWSAVTMTTVGYGDKVPSSRIGKFLGIIWIFISILFFSLFTANASAKLVNYQVSSKINTVDDLRKVEVVAAAKSSGEEFLIREAVQYTPKRDVSEAIQAVLDGKADAVVSNVPVLKYENKTNFSNQLLISDRYLMRNNMGIALPEDSPWREKINTILLEKIAEPKWQAAVFRYIGE